MFPSKQIILLLRSILGRCRESLGTQPHAGSSLPEHAAVILREEQQMRTGESSVSAFAIVLAHPSLRLRENALLEVPPKIPARLPRMELFPTYFGLKQHLEGMYFLGVNFLHVR